MNQLINLLLPRDGSEYTLKLVIRNDKVIIEHHSTEEKMGCYFKYQTKCTSENMSQLIEDIKHGTNTCGLPNIYFTQPYLNKLRTSLGWKPNPFNFFNKIVSPWA